MSDHPETNAMTARLRLWMKLFGNPGRLSRAAEKKIMLGLEREFEADRIDRAPIRTVRRLRPEE